MLEAMKTAGRPPVTPTATARRTLELAEIIGALSHALDLTEGQPKGHTLRCCRIGIAIGAEIWRQTLQAGLAPPCRASPM